MLDAEKSLIKKVKKGNQRAFRKLYELHAGYALRTAYGMTKNHEAASDIVQETFLKVFRFIDQYDPNRSFKAWFYQILINTGRSYLRKQSKEPFAVESEEIIDYLHHQHAEENMLENHEQLEDALDQLSETYRTILLLKYVNECTEKEIAEILELNINTVKSRLYRARNQMKKWLGGAELDQEKSR
ncbi:RNA polymerase sigma factor [Ornithinibacillus gellani]|uniref:RNA polymerase sigma factor n=1 Tax=Ornithinibacillus gellani TaxID=2293253 RepID=UPI000F4AC4CE|nr:RNA polymerase sigma factor [Ornithinibacillus gellani]TQS70539.1 RNA polymerase sigma factor [Ornithinibacillus gellani]